MVLHVAMVLGLPQSRDPKGSAALAPTKDATMWAMGKAQENYNLDSDHVRFYANSSSRHAVALRRRVWVNGECRDSEGTINYFYDGEQVTCAQVGSSAWGTSACAASSLLKSDCPVTCNDCACEDKSPTTISVGGDLASCATLAASNFCGTYDFVDEQCPVTCGECTARASGGAAGGAPAPVVDTVVSPSPSPPPSPPPPSPSPPSCTDNKGEAWCTSQCATPGNCHTNWCQTKCMRTCDMCPTLVTAVDYVAEHNAKRALHEETPELVYDATLAAAAQAYADTCPTGHATDLGGTGENLYWRGSSVAGPAVDYLAAVEAWYEEIKDYTWPQTSSAAESNGGVVGHFTQVVWKDTLRVGCGGNSNCNNMFGGSWLNNAVVCRYDPSGNWVGQYYLKVEDLVQPG